MRELIYYVAITLDGKIAGPDGSFDFFPMDENYARAMNEEWSDGLPTGLHQVLGSTPPLTKWDTVIMGRGTFQPAIDAGIASPYAHLDQYVFSSSLDPNVHRGVNVVDTDPAKFVRALKQRPGGNIWLCGGGRLAGSLAPQIDRLVLKLNPVVAGAGIGLFDGPFAPSRWRLVEQQTFELGVVLLQYVRAEPEAR